MNEIGAGLSLTSVMLWAELTASTDTGSKLTDFGCAFIFGASPLPFSLIARTPNLALLFSCNRPFWFPFATGTDATVSVHEPCGGITDGQLFEVTTNPLLTVGGERTTDAAAAVLITVTFADLPWWPTTWPENERDLGLALSVAKTGLGDAVGVGVSVNVGVAVGMGVPVGVGVPLGAVLDAVGVGELLGVAEMLAVGVAVAVLVAVAVAVAVGVGAPLPPGNNPNTANCVCVPM